MPWLVVPPEWGSQAWPLLGIAPQYICTPSCPTFPAVCLQAMARRTRAAGWHTPLASRAPAAASTPPARPPWWRPTMPTEVRAVLTLHAWGDARRHARTLAHLCTHADVCRGRGCCKAPMRMRVPHTIVCLSEACRHPGWRERGGGGGRRQPAAVARDHSRLVPAAGDKQVLSTVGAHAACHMPAFVPFIEQHATHLKGVQSVCQPATLAQQTSGFQIIFGRCCAGAVARGPLPVL